MQEPERDPPGIVPLGIVAILLRLGAIGAVMLGIIAVFAYVGGFLSPNRVTPERLIGALALTGSEHGFRRNHAEGLCGLGTFQSSGQAVRVSKAAVFAPAPVPVVARFAIAGGMPFQADTPPEIRSLALRFLPEGGEEWRTGMNDIPVFPANTASDFYELLLATAPDPATGKPDPATIQPFMA